MSMYWVVTIEGLTWGGIQGTLKLTFYDFPTVESVREKAGDFQNYKIVACAEVTTQWGDVPLDTIV